MRKTAADHPRSSSAPPAVVAQKRQLTEIIPTHYSNNWDRVVFLDVNEICGLARIIHEVSAAG
jgi:hypothetical protein